MNEDSGRVVFSPNKWEQEKASQFGVSGFRQKCSTRAFVLLLFLSLATIILFPRVENLDTSLFSIPVAHLSPELLAAFLEIYLLFISLS